MKKLLCLILCAVIALSALSGCGSAPASPDSDRLSIVTTIFPVYDWTMNILGDRAADADVTMLLDNGVDLHSFQPTADDIIKISTCDVFIYVGGESDEWVEDALEETLNENMTVLDLMDILGEKTVEEEEKEGMESSAEEKSEETEYDEHIWLSLKNAQLLCGAVAEALCSADAENADIYKTNLAAYSEKLNTLETAYGSAAAAAECRTLLFCDRFPFRYLLEDYGIDYYAAFSGCSAETEASFETVSFLASKIDELGLEYIIVLEGSDGRIASTVSAAAASDCKILTMDSMQATTAKNASEGASYISVMEKNLETFKAALN